MNNRFPTDEDSEDQIPLKKEMAMHREDFDSLYQDEIRDMQRDSDIHRLSHRVTMLSILIPGLLCAIFVFAYLDTRERISQIQATGSREVQVLSEDVVDKVASLTDQYTKTEKSIADRISTLEKTSALMEKRLKGSQQEIKKLTASKVDNKTFEQTEKKRSEEVSNIFSALQEDVAQHKASFEELAKELSKKIDHGTNAMTAFQNDMDRHGKQMAKVLQAIEAIREEDKKQASLIRHLSEHKADKAQLGSLLNSKLANYEARLALLEKEIRSLNGKPHTGKQIAPAAKDNTERAAQSPQPSGKHVDETATSTPTNPPGKIIEQDIAE
jgi:septal ring factor EnvC (AmiA/AmiB activator)